MRAQKLSVSKPGTCVADTHVLDPQNSLAEALGHNRELQTPVHIFSAYPLRALRSLGQHG